jgi:hypothetical protein
MSSFVVVFYSMYFDPNEDEVVGVVRGPFADQSEAEQYGRRMVEGDVEDDEDNWLYYAVREIGPPLSPIQEDFTHDEL